MFEVTIVNILSNIWPMVVIFTSVLASYRIAYILKYEEKFILYREVLKLGFIIYIMSLFYVVTFQDVSWSSSNFIPFKEMFRYELGSTMFLKNVIGNMIMFAPYGFFISYFLKAEKKSTVICLSIIVSLTIEVTQLMIGRVFDVDDILLNIFGGLIGFYIYKLIYMIKRHLPEFFKKNIVYNIIVIGILIIVFWYLYQIMWLGV